VPAGNLPEGYELAGVKTRPQQVTVSGPSQELSDLKFIPTHPIDLSRLTETTIVATDLDFKNLHLTLKNQVPILAELDIRPKTMTRTIAGVPVAPEPGPARLQPAQVSVTIQGPWLQVKELKPADLKATVATGPPGPARKRLQVSVSLPEGLTLVRVQPAAVTASRAKTP
jgi:YbbR domain-containing protein